MRLLLLLMLTLSAGAAYGQDTVLVRELLLEDTRQLARIIEDTHPDPYVNGGGRIAFHRRLHQTLDAIPQSGMTCSAFIRLLRPFIAAVGDQHTSIKTDLPADPSAPGGVPFVFEPVESSLYILVPFLPTDESYIGSRLVSVEGVPVGDLVDRLACSEGVENEYFALRQLGRRNLLFESYLSELLPEWHNHDAVRIQIRLPSGETEEVVRDLPVELRPLHLPKSRVKLPRTDDAGFVFDFLKPSEGQEEIAYLRVDHMLGYREAREMAVAVGTDSLSAEELEAIPSATACFESMVVEMKERNTETLIVDIRDNGGGNYMMAAILVYFLYGEDVLASIQKEAARSGGGHGRRYSALYFETHPKVTMEDVNAGRRTPLVMGDIDFGSEPEGSAVDSSTSSAIGSPGRLEEYRRAPTFLAEYESGTYSAYYCPKNVLVLMTAWTSSSGLDMVLYLYRAGAILIGTPSGQAPNSWGNLLEWRLSHSGVVGEVASAFDIAFGDDPAKGRVLPVHYPLTYATLAALEFDPNAIFLYALEVLRDL